MRFGLGTLRLAPQAFWRSTPREMAAALQSLLPKTSGVPTRQDLASLLARFPDASSIQQT